MTGVKETLMGYVPIVYISLFGKEYVSISDEVN
jgi:hypothetical protein